MQGPLGLRAPKLASCEEPQNLVHLANDREISRALRNGFRKYLVDLVFEREPDFYRDLPMRNPASFKMPTRFDDFEPPHTPHGLRGLGNRVLNCVFNAN